MYAVGKPAVTGGGFHQGAHLLFQVLALGQLAEQVEVALFPFRQFLNQSAQVLADLGDHSSVEVTDGPFETGSHLQEILQVFLRADVLV